MFLAQRNGRGQAFSTQIDAHPVVLATCPGGIQTQSQQCCITQESAKLELGAFNLKVKQLHFLN
ncbi:hypothetical protein O9992_13310 [Vibrio lentus]|nr:hypothetical protein [Vibrio lentus]